MKGAINGDRNRSAVELNTRDNRGGGRRAALSVAAALVAMAGCTDSPDAVTDVGTTPTVIPPSAVQVLGSHEAIAVVQDLDILPDGSVWVLNSVEPFFVGLDASGQPLRAFGTAGGGPDEFLLPSAFVSRGIGGQSWILDLRRHGFVNVSAEGSDLEPLSLPPEVVPPGSVVGGMSMTSLKVRTERLGDEIVVPRTTGSLGSGLVDFRMAILGADLLALDPATGSVRDVVSLSESLSDPSEGFEPTIGGFPLWYRLWAVCGEGQIRVYDRTENTIRAFDGVGLEGAPTALPPVHLTEVTRREFAGAIFELRAAEISGGMETPSAADSARIMNQMIEEAEGSPTELAAYLPRYVDFRCSDDGTMWLQPIDVERGGLRGGLAWLRLQADGATQEVQLPEGFDAYRFTDQRIWGVQRDALDVASIAWIELDEVLAGQ